MADGQGYGVGRVVWFRSCGQTADTLDHVHDLALFGPAVADDGLLDLERRVFVNREIALTSNEDADAARFSNCDTGRNILVEKELLLFHKH